MLRRMSPGLVIALAVAGLLAGCADDGAPTGAPPVDGSGAPTTTTVSSAPTPTSSATTTTPASVPTTVPATAPGLPELTAVAELGYPRDLLDRGRVNIVVAREGDEPFVIVDHRLHVDGFDPAPVEERRIVVPADGQRVAIQAVFGDAVDCDAPTPLGARLAIHYLLGEEPTVHAGSIDLDDTATLADIRARFCTARRILAENDLRLGEPTLDGETFTIDLTIDRRTGDAELVVHAIQGTVLFGAESPFEQGAPERTLAPGDAHLTLSLTFDVNRCDPHAVAETTRKKGLTLWIAVAGAAPQPVDVDITAIEDDLEEILNRCKQRTGV